MGNNVRYIQRYAPADRLNHWLVAFLFFLAVGSGFPFFHPAFFFLANLEGGSTWARILHPFFGVTLFLVFLGLLARFAKHNTITEADRQWRKHIAEVMRNRARDLPEIGRYNIGQKYLFWTLTVMIPLLLVSGIILWQPYFAPRFSIGLIRLAAVVHAFAAFVTAGAIIVHIYAAYWTRGAIRGMTRGTVTTSWARHHYPGWYKEMVGGGE